MANEPTRTQASTGLPGPDVREAAQRGLSVSDAPLPSSGRKFIAFVAGGTTYAIDSQMVSEVLRDLYPTELPNTPDWLLGIANLRSEIVTVVDLRRLLGDESGPEREMAKHVVSRLETMDALIAFRVEKLREILTVENVAIESGGEKPFVSGTFSHRSEAFTVLNVGELVSSLSVA